MMEPAYSFVFGVHRIADRCQRVAQLAAEIDDVCSRHALWCDNMSGPDADGRGAVLYGDKAIDRSPGGTGTSARMAQL
ncbi:proline racemase family protein, partial [Rhizobium leguminosarum]|uniref:proline racemase family protein n=1 Tax=Rhizobium leguminosarum TaxID=384 RepID=UPI003F98DA7A